MSRRALIAKVHIGRKALCLTEAEYRDLLEAKTGKRSSADADDAGLIRLLARMKEMGFAPKTSAAGRTQAGTATSRSPHPSVRMVFALWSECAAHGAVRDASRRALAAFVKRQTGVDDPNWLTGRQAGSVIEALKAMRERGRAGP
jgi:phage gp16-like protein